MKVQQFTNTRGVSMIVALALLSLISIIALTSSYILTSSVSRNTEFGNSMRSDAAAESGINLGLIAVKDEGVGTDLPQNHVCFPDDGGASAIITGTGPAVTNAGGPCAENAVTYSVTGSAQAFADTTTYIIPPPGEGNAGEFCERAENYDSGDSSQLDMNMKKPCNWNKLHFGESIAIPLYIEGEHNNRINPAMNDLIIKVRTPCAGGITYNNGFLSTGPGDEPWCDGDRPDIDDPTLNGIDDIIVHWSLSGMCDYTGPNPYGTDYDGSCVGIAPIPSDSAIIPSLVNLGKNIGGDYAVVNGGVGGSHILDLNTGEDFISLGLVSYLQSSDPLLFQPNTTGRFFNEPVLTLTVVSPLVDDLGNSIPYLEYQVQTDEPISYSFQVVEAIGTSGNFLKTLKSQKDPGSTNIEFVIQN